MLRPNKHSHPDRTMINIALLLLTRLRSKRVEKFDALRAFAKDVVAGGNVLFVPALDLLYLLGLIEYRRKTDVFEYVGPNEAV